MKNLRRRITRGEGSTGSKKWFSPAISPRDRAESSRDHVINKLEQLNYQMKHRRQDPDSERKKRKLQMIISTQNHVRNYSRVLFKKDINKIKKYEEV